ncbi:DUF951 family protein, partial [Enterococcus faecium]
IRMGADIKIRCMNCGHIVMMPRRVQSDRPLATRPFVRLFLRGTHPPQAVG